MALVAIAQLLRGQRRDALAEVAKLSAADPSFGAAVDADIAMMEGRLNDAEPRLERGIADDLAKHAPQLAAEKQDMLAELRLRRADKRGALAAARSAAASGTASVSYNAALVDLAAGDARSAAAIEDHFAHAIAPNERALAQLLAAELARASGKPGDAVRAARDALLIVDDWHGHFVLGRAALDAKDFALATTELTHCATHRGEGGLGFSDQSGSSLRALPPAFYYLARAQEGLGDAAAAKASYEAFLAFQHGDSDAMIEDARRKVGK
jgi:hypothetical protein